MRPKICFSIPSLRNFNLKEMSFEGYEIRNIVKDVNINIIHVLNLKEIFEGIDMSMHSQLNRIFSSNDKEVPEFSEAELHILKSEILMSKIIGIKQINFHMKDSEITEEEISKFKDIIRFAKENGVEMIYENHVCSEEAIFQVLDKFPEVNFCLDMGHLNNAIGRGKFKMNLDEFLEKVKPRLVHLHAHNNSGERDEHLSLDEGTFDWRNLLDKLKDSSLRKIIIECKEEDAIKSKQLLEDYFNNESSS